MTTPINTVSGFASPAAATANTAATTDTASGTDASATAATQSLLDPQAFLQLLVAQLKYQDPSNPTDTSTFMSQTATLSEVQTMNSMSSTLTDLVNAQQAQSATNLIGKQVTYLGASGLPVTGVVSSASLASSGATLQVGNATVALGDITTVTAPTT